MTLIGEAAALATAGLWALTSICFAEAGKRIGALRVNKIRLLFATALYAVVFLATRGSLFPVGVGGGALFWLCLSSLIGVVIGDGLLFKALVAIGPRLTTLVFASSPIMTTMIAWFFLGEKLGAWDLLGIAATVAGITWVAAERRVSATMAHGPSQRQQVGFGRGILYALGGALGQAVGLVASKEGMLGTGEIVAPLDASYIRILFAALALWLLSAARGDLPETLRSARNRTAIYFTFGGAFVGPFLGIWMSLVAVSYIEAGIAATLNATVPVLVIPLVIWFYRERVSWRGVIGAIVAVAGVALIFLK